MTAADFNSDDLNTLRHQIRNYLKPRFPTIEEFDAFVIDYYHELYGNFSPGMNRIARTNALLSTVDNPEDLLVRLNAANQIDGKPLLEFSLKCVIILDCEYAKYNSAFKNEIEKTLQRLTGESLRIVSVSPGSIKITLHGSWGGIAALHKEIHAGTLTSINNIPLRWLKLESNLDAVLRLLALKRMLYWAFISIFGGTALVASYYALHAGAPLDCPPPLPTISMNQPAELLDMSKIPDMTATIADGGVSICYMPTGNPQRNSPKQTATLKAQKSAAAAGNQPKAAAAPAAASAPAPVEVAASAVAKVVAPVVAKPAVVLAPAAGPLAGSDTEQAINSNWSTPRKCLPPSLNACMVVHEDKRFYVSKTPAEPRAISSGDKIRFVENKNSIDVISKTTAQGYCKSVGYSYSANNDYRKMINNCKGRDCCKLEDFKELKKPKPPILKQRLVFMLDKDYNLLKENHPKAEAIDGSPGANLVDVRCVWSEPCQ